MTVTPWQQLTGWVQTGANLTGAKLDEFHQAGGMGILLLLYGDDASGPWNRAHVADISNLCAQHGLWLGAWHNARGEDPSIIASEAAYYQSEYGMQITMLDCEDAYQGENATKLPLLLQVVRSKLPTAEIGVSPKAVDNSMIWNGRPLMPRLSCYDRKIRVAPQWYSSYYLPDLNHGPEAQMRYLQTQQPSDPNFQDPDAPYQRSVPLSYVHPVLEATGVEGSSLIDELARLETCKSQYGFTYGFGLYNLENLSSADISLLAAKRDHLFLVV